MRVKNKLAIFSALRTNQCEICNKTECFIKRFIGPRVFYAFGSKDPNFKIFNHGKRIIKGFAFPEK